MFPIMLKTNIYIPYMFVSVHAIVYLVWFVMFV